MQVLNREKWQKLFCNITGYTVESLEHLTDNQFLASLIEQVTKIIPMKRILESTQDEGFSVGETSTETGTIPISKTNECKEIVIYGKMSSLSGSLKVMTNMSNIFSFPASTKTFYIRLYNSCNGLQSDIRYSTTTVGATELAVVGNSYYKMGKYLKDVNAIKFEVQGENPTISDFKVLFRGR